MKKYILLFLIIPFWSIACKNETHSYTDNLVTSDLITISKTDINKGITQDLYEKLFEIYLLQKIEIENQIRFNLMKSNRNDAFLSIDSITKKYNININLKEPKSPYISTQNLLDNAYFEGNQDSPITILEFINPECDLCKIVSQRIAPIFDRYKAKIRFGYILYSSDNAFSTQALLYALKREKYKELYTRITSLEQIDSTSIYNEMKELNLNINEFNQQIKFLQKKTLNTNILIQQQGINKTPTLLIKDRLIYNPLDSSYIIKKIEQYLEQ